MASHQTTQTTVYTKDNEVYSTNICQEASNEECQNVLEIQEMHVQKPKTTHNFFRNKTFKQHFIPLHQNATGKESEKLRMWQACIPQWNFRQSVGRRENEKLLIILAVTIIQTGSLDFRLYG
ncbi:13589_t:CDS:2 [Racocetra persica]|uniref:13589_t:CDS:1 n=1 Tax=Racocetra persica TaxID=160502 RepID=A0ACA9N4G9_9GLOM|nr:13589_t:CDS:2 [Racocetra persica]